MNVDLSLRCQKTEISSFVRKVKILTNPTLSRHYRLLLIFVDKQCLYNLKSRVPLKFPHGSLDIGKKIFGYCMDTFIQESCPFVYKLLRVSLVAYVFSFHLEHSFYIDINKIIISYFNTVKMLFVILFPISCKKLKHPLFLIHFGKRIEDNQ